MVGADDLAHLLGEIGLVENLVGAGDLLLVKQRVQPPTDGGGLASLAVCRAHRGCEMCVLIAQYFEPLEAE